MKHPVQSRDELDRLERNETEIFEIRMLVNKFTLFLNNSILNSLYLFFNSKVGFFNTFGNELQNKIRYQIEYVIFGEGSQISTNQKQDSELSRF